MPITVPPNAQDKQRRNAGQGIQREGGEMIDLLNINCMTYMETQPDEAFDLVIADPPYFKKMQGKAFPGGEISTNGIRRNRYEIKNWELPDRKWLEEVVRVSSHQIIWGCNYHDFSHAVGRIIWDKQNDSSSFSNAEIASTDMHYGVRMFRYLWNGMLQANMKNKEVRIHPTQKPIALYTWLLKNYAKPGQRILDTHLGSGSSAIAANYFGCDFVGCEIDKDFYTTALERFNAETSQMAMFNHTSKAREIKT